MHLISTFKLIDSLGGNRLFLRLGRRRGGLYLSLGSLLTGFRGLLGNFGNLLGGISLGLKDLTLRLLDRFFLALESSFSFLDLLLLGINLGLSVVLELLSIGLCGIDLLLELGLLLLLFSGLDILLFDDFLHLFGGNLLEFRRLHSVLHIGNLASHLFSGLNYGLSVDLITSLNAKLTSGGISRHFDTLGRDG